MERSPTWRDFAVTSQSSSVDGIKKAARGVWLADSTPTEPPFGFPLKSEVKDVR